MIFSETTIVLKDGNTKLKNNNIRMYAKRERALKILGERKLFWFSSMCPLKVRVNKGMGPLVGPMFSYGRIKGYIGTEKLC